MRTVDIREAKTNLSRLVEHAARGETFVIAKAGKPPVEVVPIEQSGRRSKFGFMKGHIRAPDDFDRLAQEEIAALFGMQP